MFNNPVILVFTDFSRPSDYAMKSAENIRRRVGGKVHAIHVSDFPVHWEWISVDSSTPLFSGEVEITLLNSLKKLMQEQITRCEIDCTSDISLGQIYDGIHSAIDKLKPTLVIMGHKGKNDGPFQLGSMTAKIVASSSKPVLVVSKVFTIPQWKVAGLVSTTGPMKAIITATEEFSFLLSAEAEIISLIKSYLPANRGLEEREFILSKLREQINKEIDTHSKCKVKVDTTEEKHVATHLAKILREDNVDLAIMERHQKGMIEKFLIGSETRRMLELFEGNILVLPPTI